MRMNEISYEGPPPIDGYGPGGFRVEGNWHAGGLLLLPEARHRITSLDDAAIELVLEAASALDLVILGMGAEIAALPKPLRGRLDAAGIGAEVMSTPSACRTYNVLLTEDRRVAVALLPV